MSEDVVDGPAKAIKGYGVKLKNRRVEAWLLDDGGFYLKFRRLMPDREIQVDDLRLSREAGVAVISLLLELGEIDHTPAAKETT